MLPQTSVHGRQFTGGSSASCGGGSAQQLDLEGTGRVWWWWLRRGQTDQGVQAERRGQQGRAVADGVSNHGRRAGRRWGGTYYRRRSQALALAEAPLRRRSP